MKLLRYLFHRPLWHKLPMMPRMYSSDYRIADVDSDTQTLMSLTHTRCPQGVELLKKRHGVKTSRELIEQLPQRRRKRRIARRVLSLLQSWFGFTSYDPARSLARQHQRIIVRDGKR